MFINKEHLEKIKSCLKIIKNISIPDELKKDICDKLKIPLYAINILSNSKYSQEYLTILLYKIEHNEELEGIDYNIYDIIKDYIMEDPQYDILRQKIKMEFINKEFKFKQYNPLKELVYSNQKDAGDLIHKLLDEKKAISLVALPQVGKTGTFLWVTYLAMINEINSKIYLPEDIFIITGMNDTEWVEQTKKDMLESIQDNVYHLGQIKKFHAKIINKINTKLLIIIDECQIATSEDLQIDIIIRDINSKLYENNIDVKYLVVSATPSVIKYDLDTWGEDHELVILEPPKSYVSFRTFIKEKRIEEAKILSIDFLNKQFLPLIKLRFTTPKYHIIRCSEKKRKELVEWCNINKFSCKPFDSYNSVDKQRDCEWLNEEPKEHQFIVIKNFWRAGKRMIDKHIGIIYEYNDTKNIDITAQGLIARFCGNDKQSKKSDAPYFFGNISILIEYIEFIKSKCDFNISDYHSKKIEIVEGEVKQVKPSFAYNISPKKTKAKGYSSRDYIHIPKCIDIDDELYSKIANINDTIKSNACQIIIDYLYKNDIYEYVSTYKNVKLTIPQSDNSYKRHIIDTKQCISQGKVCKTDIGKEYKYENVWVGFIDCRSEPKKIYIIIYNGMKYENLKNQKF